jgi:lipopolysaccharide export system protein LptA
MSKLSSTVRAAVAVVVTVAALAAFAAGEAGAAEKAASRADAGKFRGPLKITSERLSADNKAGVVVFEGSVVARNEEMTLSADRMDVSYSSDGEVTRIVAVGGVRLVRKEGVLSAGRAVYVQSEQRIVFTEGPRAVEGGNIITGTRMVYLIEEDRSIVENSTVIIEGK